MGAENSVGGAHGVSDEDSVTAHVLICDDERRLAALMGGLLEQCGYRATAVTSGVAAIAAVEDGGVDAVLLDVNLPGEDTATILKELHQLAPELPVLLSSGYPADDLDDDIVKAPNVAHYLDKPYTVDKLVSVLRSVLGTRSG